MGGESHLEVHMQIVVAVHFLKYKKMQHHRCVIIAMLAVIDIERQQHNHMEF